VEAASDNGFSWLLADRRWFDQARRVEQFLSGRVPRGVEVLKQTFNRLVARIPPAGDDPFVRPLVAKVFPMRSVGQRLFRWRRYGPREAANLLEAARRGVPVPAVMGLGVQRRWGLVRHSVVLMEDLAPRQPVGQLLRDGSGDVERQRRILMATVGLFVAMYRVGCHNTDVNDKSIFLMPDAAEPAKVIDFQHTWFLDGPDAQALAYQAAHFAQQCAPYVPLELLEEWASRLAEQAGLAGRAEWGDLFRGLASRPLTRHQRREMRHHKGMSPA
jgi:hypothetical protein